MFARRHTWLMAATLALMLGATDASAEPSTADKTTARVLFDDGRKLAGEGKYQEACTKLAESNRLDPGAGVMFHLANCYEKIGRTATAWQMFLEVASLMRSERQEDREKAARERASALEPQLSRLTIQVAPEARIAGMVVKRDGQPTAEAVWGSAVPVDSGKHTIEASAPGRRPFTQEVLLNMPGATVIVNVPVLAPENAVLPTPSPGTSGASPVGSSPAAAPPTGRLEVTKSSPLSSDTPLPPAADSRPANSGSGQRTIGLIVGGAGVIGFGVGTVIALGAKSKYDDASKYCVGNVCTQEGKDARDDAITKGNVATIVGGIGLAALVGGAVLWLTAPKASGNKTSTALVAGPGSLTLKGTW